MSAAPAPPPICCAFFIGRGTRQRAVRYLRVVFSLGLMELGALVLLFPTWGLRGPQDALPFLGSIAVVVGLLAWTGASYALLDDDFHTALRAARAAAKEAA